MTFLSLPASTFYNLNTSYCTLKAARRLASALKWHKVQRNCYANLRQRGMSASLRLIFLEFRNTANSMQTCSPELPARKPHPVGKLQEDTSSSPMPRVAANRKT